MGQGERRWETGTDRQTTWHLPTVQIENHCEVVQQLLWPAFSWWDHMVQPFSMLVPGPEYKPSHLGWLGGFGHAGSSCSRKPSVSSTSQDPRPC